MAPRLKFVSGRDSSLLHHPPLGTRRVRSRASGSSCYEAMDSSKVGCIPLTLCLPRVPPKKVSSFSWVFAVILPSVKWHPSRDGTGWSVLLSFLKNSVAVKCLKRENGSLIHTGEDKMKDFPSEIYIAVQNGSLKEPFGAKDVKRSCPGWADHTYSNFLPKHAVGNPSGTSELFERMARGRYRTLRQMHRPKMD